MGGTIQHEVLGAAFRERAGDKFVFVVPSSGHDERRDAGDHADSDTMPPRHIARCPPLGNCVLRIPKLGIKRFAEHEWAEHPPESSQVVHTRLPTRFGHNSDMPFDRVLAASDVVQSRFDEYQSSDVEPAGCCGEHCRYGAERVGMQHHSRA